MTGPTNSANFPTTAGAFDTTSTAADDAFVTKLDATGAALVYSTYLGGSGDDVGYGIAVDGAGNAYVTGIDGFDGLPHDRWAPSTRRFNGGRRRLRDEAERDRRRPRLLDLPGRKRRADAGYGIAVDGAGNAYVTGQHATRRTSRRPRAPSTRPQRRHRRRLRDEAERDRRRPRLLHLPGRERPADDRQLGIASTAPATPT